MNTHFVGIDPGNSSAKVVAIMAGGLEQKIIIPNVSAMAEELDIPPAAADPLAKIDIEILNPAPGYEGERFIGELAARQFAGDVEQDRNRDKANSDNINLITPAALALLCHAGDKVVLGIGSPFSDFQNQRSQIIERLQRRFRIRFGKYAGARAGEIVDFEVIQVSPYPQTAAAFIDQATGPAGRNHPEWANQNLIIFDLGLGQTGVAYISAGEPIKAGCFSVDEPAFLRVAKGVQSFINEKFYCDMTIPEALQIVEAGKYQIRNESVDINGVIFLELELLAKALRKRLEEKVVSRLRNEANSILLVGGGAAASGAGGIFKAEFGLPVYVGHDPRFSNARGFLVHAKKKYEKDLNHAGTR